jgi:subtilisin family serine protease
MGLTALRRRQHGKPTTEGKERVPLRLPRPVIAAAAIGLAITWSAAGSVPALASGAAKADQVRSQEWWLSALHITQAWQTTKGSGVTIALLDTGVAVQHPDLTGSVISSEPDFTNSGEKLGGQFFGIHGTAMAGLIVGHGHGAGNSDGVLGVAPEAKLLSVRVTLDSGDPLLSDSGIVSGLPAAIAAGIRFAVANGAQVIDLPLDPAQSLSALTATPFPANPGNSTSGQPGTASAADAAAAAGAAGGSTAEQQAVQFALSKGVVLVAPAGDNNATTDSANFPAAYPGVISVGAFDSSLTKTPFTSHQSYVTLTAAGSGMIAAVPGGGYATVSSTSAASAIVTGIVALIKSQYPELTPAQVSQALTRGTGIHHSGNATDGSGAGTADAAKALTAAAAIAAPGPPRAGSGSVSGQLPPLPAAAAAAPSTLASKLKLDGLLSLLLLAVLLLPTLGYAYFGRRRSVGRARVQIEPVAAAHTPYAYNPASETDLVSEYFAPLPGEPGFRGAGAEGSGRWAAVSGAGAPGGGNGHGADDGTDGLDGTASGTGPVVPRLHVPFARLTVARPPRVSGSPPWGPAPRPRGVLPWAGEPAPEEPPGPEPDPEPERGEPARPMAAPLPQRRPGAPRGTGPESRPPASPNEAGTEGTGPPIYVWNPAAATDVFPAASGAVPESRPGDEQPGDTGDWQPYGWPGDTGR